MSNFELGLTQEAVINHLQTHGRKGTLTLSLLGRNQPAYEAITSPVGQVILSKVMAKMEIILEKITNLAETETERIEYKVLKDCFDDWAKIISTQQNAANKIKGG